MRELRDLLRALGVSDVRMEEGSLRCDVNTSLSPRGSGRWGTRTETKNVNSLRSVERAVHYEIERQAAVLDAGERVIQETRHFHEDSGITTSGRSKEEAQDYRYFPEPDLVPLAPPRDWVEQIRRPLPELPSARRTRLQEAWGITAAETTTSQRRRARPGRADDRGGATPADARKWWLNELARRANDTGAELGDLPITPADVAGRAALVPPVRSTTAGPPGHRGRAGRRGTPDEVVAARDLAVVSDDTALERRGGRGDRRQPRRRRQDPRRQGRCGRRPRRCGDEGHARPGRRVPGPRADPRPPRSGLARVEARM